MRQHPCRKRCLRTLSPTFSFARVEIACSGVLLGGYALPNNPTGGDGPERSLTSVGSLVNSFTSIGSPPSDANRLRSDAHGLAPPCRLPRRRPRAVLPHREHRTRPPADRGGASSLSSLRGGRHLPDLGSRVRPGRRRLGRHE